MIRLRDVSSRLPGTEGSEILSSIDLEIGDGEWVAVTGRNGSGKSTLCRLIAGLQEPSGGSVEIDGLDPHLSTGAGGRGVPVGLAFQNPDSQFLASTVTREVLFGMENIGLSPDEMERRLGEALDVFDLRGCLSRNPHTLSGGEKQRALLASIWVMRPRHLILDEPFSFLDRRSRRSFLESVRVNFHGEGRTVIWSTLEPEEISLADRVLYIEGGRVAFDGSPGDLEGIVSEDVLTAPLSLLHEGGGESAVSREPSGRGRLVIEIRDAVFSPGGGDFVLSVPELSITHGETLGVLGPSGSGKTTLLSGCSGLLPPGGGEVSVFGKRIRSRRDFPAGRIAYLFQTPEEGFFAPTVFEEVALGCRVFRRGRDVGEEVSRALSSVGLEPGRFLERSPFHLSQGEKRLVAIASMLVLPADVFILDEPTLFLDGGARRLLASALENIRSSGACTITASHEKGFIESRSDRLICLEGGRVVSGG